MNEQDKQLLLNDLCARLPYGLFVEENREKLDQGPVIYTYDYHPYITDCKPYLRPMPSMTKEEKEIYQGYQDAFCTSSGDIHYFDNFISIDYLNCKHFDYRGLIPMGLALPAHEGMY